MKLEKVILKSTKITEINEAISLIKHFVELSSKLLPYLAEINEKEELSIQDISNREKIIDVFKSYRFDTKSSTVLMNSTILELIQNAYEQIKLVNKVSSRKALNSFWLEHDRLMKDWSVIESN
ncbi:MAG: hypothetical protein V4638_06090 [Bacteroidota bacterium]